MNGLVKLLAIVVGGCNIASAADKTVAKAVEAAEDAPLKTDSSLPFWQESPPVILERDIQGKTVPEKQSLLFVHVSV
jgi:hypothetical protein